VLPGLPRSADKIRLLKGEFSIRGSSRMLTFEFGTLDKLGAAKAPPPKTLDGVTVTVKPVKLKGRHWTVRVTTQLPPGGADFESHESWAVQNQAYLLNKDGRTRLPSSGYAQLSSTSRKAVFDYHFEDTPRRKRGEPSEWRLVYRAPAGIVEVPIPFEFKNVPLP
jgi:hypothetical protein